MYLIFRHIISIKKSFTQQKKDQTENNLVLSPFPWVLNAGTKQVE